MHLVIVNQHPSVALGGSETQCALIAERLLAAGHDVTYVAVGGSTGSLPERLKVVDVPYRSGEVARAVADARADAVYWRFGTRFLPGVLRRLRTTGPPVVLASSHRDDLVRWAVPPSARRSRSLRLAEGLRDRLRSAFDHRALRRVHGVIVNNPSHLELVSSRRVVHIPNGVRPAAVPKRRARPYVTWVANLKPSKRPEVCIGLAEAIEDLGVDVVMVGRAQVAEYEGFAERTDLPENLVLLGPLAPGEADGVLAGSLVHVHTCLPEGFPNVFLQAWRAGVPSVSLGFDPGGVIKREGLGFSADDDVERFYDAVRELIVDDARRSSAGGRARAYVNANHDPDRNAAALVTFIGTVIRAVA